MSTVPPAPTTNRTIASPFDPFLVRFLTSIASIAGGFSLQANGRDVAQALDCDPAFVEALSVSARRRSLIEVFYSPTRRNQLRWRVSARGEAFLKLHEPSTEQPETQTEA